MVEEQKEEITEYEKSHNWGKIIAYGTLIAFAGSIIMCAVSLTLLLRTFNLVTQVSERNEELRAQYEAFENQIAAAEQSISTSEANIEKNTAVLTTTIDGQTQFVNELYKAMLARETPAVTPPVYDKKEDQPQPTTSSKTTDALDEMLDIEVRILTEMLNQLAK